MDRPTLQLTIPPFTPLHPLSASLDSNWTRRRPYNIEQLAIQKIFHNQPPMSFNNTPPEITDYVLDFLHDNPKALRACAQVCSTWLPTSYYHLFSRIALKSPKSCSAFCRVLQNTPRIGHLVHDLSLVLPRRTRDIDPATESVDDPLPLSACASLKDLDHLSIIVWDFDTCSWSCLMTLHSLTHLTLRHCRFPSFQTFTTFVAAFPCLSTLDVGDVYWDTEVLDGPTGSSCQQLGREPSLETLVLGAVTSLQSIVDWLLHQGLHSQITSISTRCSSEADALALNSLCAGIGGSLQSLGLDWMCPKSTSGELSQFLLVERLLRGFGGYSGSTPVQFRSKLWRKHQVAECPLSYIRCPSRPMGS